MDGAELTHTHAQHLVIFELLLVWVYWALVLRRQYFLSYLNKQGGSPSNLLGCYVNHCQMCNAETHTYTHPCIVRWALAQMLANKCWQTHTQPHSRTNTHNHTNIHSLHHHSRCHSKHSSEILSDGWACTHPRVTGIQTHTHICSLIIQLHNCVDRGS